MKTILTVLSVCICTNILAQVPRDLYMPLEFQRAYEKGTRKADGSVSPTYWQNRSEYKIKASVDPLSKLLKGEATIVYHHNGPDTIRRPTFHTYHDFYRADSKKGGFFGSGSGTPVSDGVAIESIMVNGEAYDVKDEKKVTRNGTNYIIALNKPLAPKTTLELKINWHYIIPGKGFERSGAIDSTSMLIGYWYPEMSVLDDVDGWDRIVYDAGTEFYHDYSDYDVEIEVPDNFMVWASVAPANEAEVYSAAVRERIAKARKSVEPLPIWTAKDFKPLASKRLKWKYVAKNFPDFTFALSDHFLWDGAMFKDANGEYFISAAYPPDHAEFAVVTKTIAASLKIFHNDFPAYPFPFKHFTIFNGLMGGGMEFPGMANDESISGAQMEKWTGQKTTDFDANLGLSLHEMTHMYFPFLMGIHEKKYGWMDEGMASFSEYFLSNQTEFNFDQSYLGNLNVVPVMVPSHIVSSGGINSYTIGAHSYNSLFNLVGKDMFRKCLKAYMDTWNHRHPTPYDFMFTFNTASGTNLNWFWKRWYFDWGYVDLGIKEVKDNTIVVENKGGRPVASQLKLTFADGTTAMEPVSPAVWKDSNEYKHIAGGGKTLAMVEIKVKNGDAVAANNVWKK